MMATIRTDERRGKGGEEKGEDGIEGGSSHELQTANAVVMIAAAEVE